ncbi:TetR/AcrR family transcriptional regulator [Paenibacillus sp. JDR-2]|uniref:TetR/AcrR family transcriptional regulator n=1 Tax=Paenibacillus sp. (strain JDR-2) TaxID=324057 RepID=UPI0001666CD9|nr:TetR/AcrR family transcriptional regulator [Paenibacillus sp. JDR-2]ACT01208.1 transcriptional regulator, TetR family [Paenibacillus sp. JDR-2]
MTPKEETKDPHAEMRSKLVAKVIPIVRKNGFQALRMETICKYMDVSKATMYKYFASKEEVMGSAVDVLVEFIEEFDVDAADTVDSYGTVFQQLLEQSILIAAYISDGFLNELQAVYPDLHVRLTDAMKKREKKILEIHLEGKNKGIYNAFNENLLFLQEHVLVRAMMDVKFLMSYQMSLEEVLLEYYKLMKHQLFKQEYRCLSDDAAMAAKCEFLAKKITRDLF